MSQTIQLWTKSKAHARQLADITTELEVTTCWCGIPVGVPSNLLRYARNHAEQEVYCPLGHSFVFGDTNEAKLKRERDRAARGEAAWHLAERVRPPGGAPRVDAEATHRYWRQAACRVPPRPR
jgi:hypothetical protein